MENIQQTILSDEMIQFTESVLDWKESIQLVAQPLLKAKVIEERYVQAMIETVTRLGDYIVLVPKVAMPHARHEDGAIGTGVSILKLETPVLFGTNKEVSLLFCLATSDNESHLKLLQQISACIDEEEKVDALLNTSTKKEFLTLANNYMDEFEKENEEEF